MIQIAAIERRRGGSDPTHALIEQRSTTRPPLAIELTVHAYQERSILYDESLIEAPAEVCVRATTHNIADSNDRDVTGVAETCRIECESRKYVYKVA